MVNRDGIKALDNTGEMVPEIGTGVWRYSGATVRRFEELTYQTLESRSRRVVG
jgi:hypothetical protein